jgi:hypothetical protein
MNKEQVLGAIRHSLTFVGGVLVTKGLIEEGLVLEIVGGVTSIVGIVWSFVEKIKG